MVRLKVHLNKMEKRKEKIGKSENKKVGMSWIL
jgi:hypothetical protein